VPQLSADARDLNWLIGNFAKRTPGVAHTMVVSTDGLAIAVSQRLDRPMADQLAAIASGVASLSQGAARYFDAGTMKQTMVEMERGLLFVMAISDGSCLTVLAASCDVGVVGYEMATLVTRVGEVLTPSLRAELQAALPARAADGRPGEVPP
jgi:predicted regulator of Ras-like GTPase activity (Roadblock/LC7/MglB family)